MDRLQYFLTIDDAARRKSALIAIAAGFGFGMAAEAIGEPFDISAYSSIAMLSTVFTVRVWLYCHAATNRQLLANPIFFRPKLFRAAIVAAVFVILTAISGPRVEAGVLDRRLRVLSDKPLSPENAEKITDSLGIAEQWHLVVPPSTLVQVRSTIKKSAADAPQLQTISGPANALARYDREIGGPYDDVPVQVRAAYERALESFLALSTPSPAAYSAALSSFTRVIILSDGYPRLQARALLFRATLYLLGGEIDKALADAKIAEALGTLDLGEIFLIEGSALARGTNPEDLKRAIRLLTLADQMGPGIGQDSLMYHTLALGSRCLTYYHLGEFQETITDAQKLLTIVPPQLHFWQSALKLLSLSYLRIGDYANALKTAEEYAKKVRSPEAMQWLDLVRYYPTDPQFALNELTNSLEGTERRNNLASP